jgi:hypothetical protein
MPDHGRNSTKRIIIDSRGPPHEVIAVTLRLLLPALLAAAPLAPGQSQLARRYSAGDTIRYVMTGVHAEAGRDTLRYRATARGTVARDSLGRWAEHLTWTRLERNGTSVALAADLAQETLTLAPEWQVLPDLRHVDPGLVGPVLDLFTFYVDAKLAAQAALRSPGDSVVLPLGVGGSWADGQSVILGKDAVDFEIRLVALTADRTTVQVRHVPPHADKLDLPASWMREPVAQLPNNWVEVTHLPDGRYRARVGAESFSVDLGISRADGRILSASMQNPVDIVERDCDDRALSVCGAPRRYWISRVITLDGSATPAR